MPKYYFRVPGPKIAVDDPNAPKIGSIFVSLKRPTSSLNQADIPFTPQFSLTRWQPQTNFSDTMGNSYEGSAGAFAEGALGSGDAIYSYASDRKNAYKCDTLETEEFVGGQPTKEFVAQSIIASQDVQNYISESFLGNKKVYMIAGLKIATNLKVLKASSSEHGPELRVGLDPTGTGAVIVGPQGGIKFENSRRTSYEVRSSIVFAFRAVKITQRRDGSIDFENVSGGLYSADEEPGKVAQEWDVEDMNEEELCHEFPEAVAMETTTQN